MKRHRNQGSGFGRSCAGSDINHYKSQGICGRRLLGVGQCREGEDKSRRKAGEGWGRGLHGDLGSCDF